MSTNIELYRVIQSQDKGILIPQIKVPEVSVIKKIPNPNYNTCDHLCQAIVYYMLLKLYKFFLYSK